MKLPSPEEFFKKLLQYINHLRRIGNPRELLAVWFAIHDPETPPHAKAALIAVITYFVFPFDLLPDPIFIDDMAILVNALSRFAGIYVTDKHRRQADEFLRQAFG